MVYNQIQQYIDLIRLTSNLWNPEARSGLAVVIDFVDFQTTHEGIHTLVGAIQRKNSNPHLRHIRRTGRRYPRLRAILFETLRFLSVKVCHTRIGLWPSTQLANEQALIGSYRDYATSGKSRSGSGVTDSPTGNDAVTGNSRQIPNTQSDDPSEPLRTDYSEWATECSLATTATLGVVTVVFGSESNSLDVQFDVTHMCGKLFLTPGTVLSTSVNGNRENPSQSDRAVGMLLGHCGTQAHLSVSFARQTPPSLPASITTNSWCLNSLCLGFLGFRAALMEEFLDILQQSLIVPTDDTPTSTIAASKSTIPRIFTTPATLPRRKVVRFRSVGQSSESMDPMAVVSNSKSINDSRPPRWAAYLPRHICVTFAPPSPINNSRSNGGRMISGFRFEIIRHIFKTSFELKLQHFSFSSELPPPPPSPTLGQSIPTKLPQPNLRHSISTSTRCTSHEPIIPHSSSNQSTECTPCLSQRIHSYHRSRVWVSQQQQHHHRPAQSTHLADLDQDGCFYTRPPSHAASSGRFNPFPVVNTTTECQVVTIQLDLIGCQVSSGWITEANCCALDVRLGDLSILAERSTWSPHSLSVLWTGMQSCYIYTAPEAAFLSHLVHVISGTISHKLHSREPLSRVDASLVETRRLGGNLAQCRPHSVATDTCRKEAHFHTSNDSWTMINSSRVGADHLDRYHYSVHMELGSCGVSSEDSSSDKVDDVENQIDTPAFVFIFEPDLTLNGIQLGFESFGIDSSVSLTGRATTVGVLRTLCTRSESNIRVKGFHVAHSNSNLSYSISSPRPSHQSAPNESLSYRTRQDLFDHISNPTPRSSTHRWGHILSVYDGHAEVHNGNLNYVIQGLQFEWSVMDMTQLSDSLSPLKLDWLHGPSRDRKDGTIPLSSSFNALHSIRGEVNSVCVFLITNNQATLVVRSGAIQQHMNAPLNASPSEIQRVWSVGSLRATYEAERCSDQSKVPASSKETSDIHDELTVFKSSTVRIQVQEMQKWINIHLDNVASVHWTLATHLCLEEVVQSMLESMRHVTNLSSSSSPSSLSYRPSSSMPVDENENVSKSHWSVRFQAPTNVQVTLQLNPLEVNHLLIHLQHIDLRWTPSIASTTRPTRSGGSSFRVTLSQVAIRCATENIFLLKVTSILRFLRGRKTETTRPKIPVIIEPVDSDMMSHSRFDSSGKRAPEQFNLLDDTTDTSNESDEYAYTLPLSLLPDYVVTIKHFIVEIKDDPFESRLNDNYMVLLAEQLRHEQMNANLKEQLQQSGLQLTESDQRACFQYLEQQRATEYRARIVQFRQDCPTTNDLFRWTMDNVHLKALADASFSSAHQMLDHIRRMDSCSPWPSLSSDDFSTLWCRMISLNVDSWCFHLRDYAEPSLKFTDLFLWGHLAAAQRRSNWLAEYQVPIVAGKPWPDNSVTRSCWPLKFYYDFSADVKQLTLCHGSNWEPAMSWLGQRLESIVPRPRDRSTPRLGWWDRVRHLLHGRLYIAAEQMDWMYATSLNPYNATEFFNWQWTLCTVCWETGHFLLKGDFDIIYRTASKYDGVCHLLHLPALELDVRLDWLSFGNPYDHHAVQPCNWERLSLAEAAKHDTYSQFRGNRLAGKVRFSVSPAGEKPWCLFYTTVMKIADKLRMCLSKVSRPIRRGRVFHYRPTPKALFGRLLQNLELSFNLPQLECIFWVSYANRSGVHVTTGPVQLVAELRHTVEQERKHTLSSDGNLSDNRQVSFVMIPPLARTPIPAPTTSRKHISLIRRPVIVWSVVRLSASVQDIRIRLRNRPNLPGQVVQLLLKRARQCQTTHPQTETPNMAGSIDSESTDSDSSLSEDFLMLSQLQYEQLQVAALPPSCNRPGAPGTVRFQIPGRRTSCTTTSSPVSRTAQSNDKNVGNNVPMDAHRGGENGSVEGETAAPVGQQSDDRSTNVEPMTHEQLTPTHRLVVNGLKLRWTEHNRNLVYTLMDTYEHAQRLKKNLSAQATQALELHAAGGGGGGAMSSNSTAGRRWPSGAVFQGFRNTGGTSIASNLSTYQAGDVHPSEIDGKPITASSRPRFELHDPCDDKQGLINVKTSEDVPRSEEGDCRPDSLRAGDTNQSMSDELDLTTASGSLTTLASSSKSSRMNLPGPLDGVPMLTQLLEEMETARFFAYCEEMMLKTNGLDGYVLVSASRAKLDALAHPPVWKDAQLLNKSSLVGHLECMQYYATVGQILPGQPDQWLSTADVSLPPDPDADEDALSGRPEVVGSGRAVGGVVSACVNPPHQSSRDASSFHLGTTTDSSPPPPPLQPPPMSARIRSTQLPPRLSSSAVSGRPAAGATSDRPTEGIQLQRMISRCSCQVFYVHYEPADPTNLPLPHLVPPLPLDETDVGRTQEGANTVTLLHHTLKVCTNSLQYHMIVDIVNDLLLYVEPQRKAQFERNRVALGLMSPSQVRSAIGRDQDTLRLLVSEQRRIERDLWLCVRSTMTMLDKLDAARSATVSMSTMRAITTTASLLPVAATATMPNVSEQTDLARLCIQYARHLEGRIATVKTRIIDQNTLLSQRLAYYQQLHIQAQRHTMRAAMQTGNEAPMSSDNLNVHHATAGSEGKFRREDRSSLSPGVPVTTATNTTATVGGGGGPIPTSVGGQTSSAPDNWSNSSAAQHRKSSDGKQNTYPAEVIRRSEVCFEHALWRMTETDGQIGLADVELRGFLYVKTHRQDDAGSHWLELGWIRVDSLAPNSFYEEVLVPDVGGGQYAGGPILRIACSELTPVGGLSVKEAMEISVAPMLLQVSKQFYGIMMPFFFPEKPEEQLFRKEPEAGSWARTRLPLASSNIIRHLHRSHTTASASAADRPIVPPVSLTGQSADPTGLVIARDVIEGEAAQVANLTVAAAMAGQTSVDAEDPTLAASLDTDTTNLPAQIYHSLVGGDYNLAGPSIHSTHSTLDGQNASETGLTSFGATDELWFQALFAWLTKEGSSSAGDFPFTLDHIRGPTLVSDSGAASGPSDPPDPVDVMRERARKNHAFLYIKIPGFPICLSYKGEKQKNLTDVTRFQLTIPTLEYHNCVWTWLDFMMEVKTRIRKQLVREVIKKKFTPRRRLPFSRLARLVPHVRSSNTTAAATTTTTTLSTSSSTNMTWSGSVVSLTTTTTPASRIGSIVPLLTASSSDSVNAISNAAREERSRREVEMLLGRHAQPVS